MILCMARVQNQSSRRWKGHDNGLGPWGDWCTVVLCLSLTEHGCRCWSQMCPRGWEVGVLGHQRWTWFSWNLAICQQLWAKFPGSCDMVSAFIYHEDSWENIQNKTRCTCFYKWACVLVFFKLRFTSLPLFRVMAAANSKCSHTETNCARLYWRFS